MLWKNNVNSCRLNVRNEGYAEVLILKMIYISKFRKDIKPLKIKFRKTIRNGARIYTPEFVYQVQKVVNLKDRPAQITDIFSKRQMYRYTYKKATCSISKSLYCGQNHANDNPLISVIGFNYDDDTRVQLNSNQYRPSKLCLPKLRILAKLILKDEWYLMTKIR